MRTSRRVYASITPADLPSEIVALLYTVRQSRSRPDTPAGARFATSVPRRHGEAMLTLEGLREACDAVTDWLKEYPHLSEAVYQRALQQELQERGHAVEAEKVLPVKYKHMQVGTVRADLIAHPRPEAVAPGLKTVIELKKAPKITQGHIDQLHTYMALSARQLAGIVNGAVVNFGASPAEIHFVDGAVFWDKLDASRPSGANEATERERD
jgi:GxxExxY protein